MFNLIDKHDAITEHTALRIPTKTIETCKPKEKYRILSMSNIVFLSTPRTLKDKYKMTVTYRAMEGQFPSVWKCPGILQHTENALAFSNWW